MALFVLLFGALALMNRLDSAWILVRRAAGHDQRTGVLGRIFAVTAVVCALGFAVLVPGHPRPRHEPRRARRGP